MRGWPRASRGGVRPCAGGGLARVVASQAGDGLRRYPPSFEPWSCGGVCLCAPEPAGFVTATDRRQRLCALPFLGALPSAQTPERAITHRQHTTSDPPVDQGKPSGRLHPSLYPFASLCPPRGRGGARLQGMTARAAPHSHDGPQNDGGGTRGAARTNGDSERARPHLRAKPPSSDTYRYANPVFQICIICMAPLLTPPRRRLRILRNFN